MQLKKIYKNTFNGCPKDLIIYRDGTGQPWTAYLNKTEKEEIEL